jgi:hypothetical protein
LSIHQPEDVMPRIGFAALLSAALSTAGCASLERFDQAAADMATGASCTHRPSVGVYDDSVVSCSALRTTSVTTTTTVEEPGKPPVTTRTVTTRSGTTTEVVPTP